MQGSQKRAVFDPAAGQRAVILPEFFGYDGTSDRHRRLGKCKGVQRLALFHFAHGVVVQRVDMGRVIVQERTERGRESLPPAAAVKNAVKPLRGRLHSGRMLEPPLSFVHPDQLIMRLDEFHGFTRIFPVRSRCISPRFCWSRAVRWARRRRSSASALSSMAAMCCCSSMGGQGKVNSARSEK